MKPRLASALLPANGPASASSRHFTMSQLPPSSRACSSPSTHPPPESAAVVEALVAARLEQRLEAQLSDFLDVVLAKGCRASVLESAASMGRHELLGTMLKRLQISLPAQQADIRSDITAAWHAAADKGHAQCLRLLLDSCTSPASMAELLDAWDDQGYTALMRAAQEGSMECMQLLVQHSTPSQVALNSAFGWNALMRAAEWGHSSCLQLLLAQAPDTQVAAVDAIGRNALMLAAEHGHASCLQLLLQHSPNAQVAVVDVMAGTALMAAVGAGQAACVKLLLEHSPDVQLAVVSEVGQGALFLAAIFAHVDCLQLLLSHGPPQQQLDGALVGSCNWLKDQGDEISEQEQLDYKKCITLLLAHGAMLTAQASNEVIAIVRPINQQLAARALVPDMANEAVVGLASAVKSRDERPAMEKDAAGPSKRARPSC